MSTDTFRNDSSEPDQDAIEVAENILEMDVSEEVKTIARAIIKVERGESDVSR